MDGLYGKVCRRQLLNVHTVKSGTKNFELTERQTQLAGEWLSRLDAEELVSEKQNHPRFLTNILVGVLGYDEDDVKYEKGAGGGISRTPDFTILSGGKPLCFVEVKGSATGLFESQGRRGEQKTPFSQLQDQINNSSPRPKYGIVSNYNDFLLMTLEHGTRICQKFTFEDIRSGWEKLAEFVWIFGHMVRGREVESQHQKSIEHDNEITEKFYSIFNDLRLSLMREFGGGQITEDSVSLTQTFLNRVVFILFAEDLNLAPNRMRKILSGASERGTETTSLTFDAITCLFAEYDAGGNGIAGFNGGLFAEPFDRNAVIRDKKGGRPNPVIEKLTRLATYNFETEVSVDILGRIFEQSVSDIDRLKRGESRSEGGVYYTPERITDYICRNTIIPYLSDGNATTPEDLVRESRDLRALQNRMQSIRILDPACGSGAFLIKAIDVLLEIHGLLVRELIMRGAAGDMEEYVEATRIRAILQNNIYGVDISEESVGITRLAIFLKIAQVGGRLPDLSGTIKAGNSLVWDKTGERHFDWHEEFAEVFEDDGDAGFDVIIGNPPYIKQAKLDNKDQMQLPAPNDLGHVGTIDRKADVSVYFFMHALNILKDRGLLGFINTDSWLHFKYGMQLQAALLRYCDVVNLVRPKSRIFRDAQIRTVVSIARRSDAHAECAVRFSSDFDGEPQDAPGVEPGNWLGIFRRDILPKPNVDMVPLGDVCRMTGGIETGHDAFYILSEAEATSAGIGEEYLEPILTKPIAGHAVYGSSPRKFLLHVQDHEGTLVASEAGTRVKEYIDAGNPRGRARGGNPRYYVKLKPPAPILISMQINDKVRVYENVGRMSALRKFTYVTPHRTEHTACYLAYLSSSYFALYQEVWGHPMGGGLLKFQIGDYAKSPVPDFSKAPGSKKLVAAWDAYKKSLDQDALDAVVFDALGISGAGGIKKALSGLVHDRLNATKR